MTDKPMTMVERVARAIMRAKNIDNPRFDLDDWINQEAVYRHGFEARCAISAMREPTEAMIVAADEIIEADSYVQRGYGFYGGVQPLHQAMIDAALTESQ